MTVDNTLLIVVSLVEQSVSVTVVVDETVIGGSSVSVVLLMDTLW